MKQLFLLQLLLMTLWFFYGLGLYLENVFLGNWLLQILEKVQSYNENC